MAVLRLLSPVLGARPGLGGTTNALFAVCFALLITVTLERFVGLGWILLVGWREEVANSVAVLVPVPVPVLDLEGLSERICKHLFLVATVLAA